MHRRIIRLVTGSATAVLVILTAGPPAAAADPLFLAVNTLPQIINNITVWILGLLIGVATLFLTIGAVRYVASGDDPGELERAKNAFKNALKGYGMAVLAPVLLAIVQSWIGG